MNKISPGAMLSDLLTDQILIIKCIMLDSKSQNKRPIDMQYLEETKIRNSINIPNLSKSRHFYSISQVVKIKLISKTLHRKKSITGIAEVNSKPLTKKSIDK